jgi:hypothetical protein
MKQSKKFKARRKPLLWGDRGHASACAIDLYALSASHEETVPLERWRKCARNSPPPKASSKPSVSSAVKGMTVCSVHFSFIIFIGTAAVIEPGLASSDARTKDSELEGARIDKQLIVDASASTRDPRVEIASAREITVCYVALVSRRTGPSTVMLSAAF